VAGEEETFYQAFPSVPRGVTSTQLTARGLAPSTGYRLRARARNSKGEGPWSPAFTCSTLEEVLPPLCYRPSATAPLLPPLCYRPSAAAPLLPPLYYRPLAASPPASRLPPPTSRLPPPTSRLPPPTSAPIG
jgi:hypothetical protein